MRLSDMAIRVVHGARNFVRASANANTLGTVHAYAILSALHFCRNYSEMKVHDCKSTAMHATTIYLAEPRLLITSAGSEAP